jgi:hypothetical protein
VGVGQAAAHHHSDARQRPDGERQETDATAAEAPLVEQELVVELGVRSHEQVEERARYGQEE